MREIPGQKIQIDQTNPWISEAPFESNFFHSLSLMLPVYERVMIEVACEAGVPSSGDLRKELIGFIRQEKTHQKIHSEYNRQLEIAGYSFESVKLILKFNDWSIKRLLPLSLRVGVCAAGEHLTSLISQYYMQRYPRYREGSNEALREIWRWHAVEEIEHRAAMHELFLNCDYSYIKRILSYFLISTWLVLPLLFYGLFLLSFQDKSLFTKLFWVEAKHRLLEKDGIIPLYLQWAKQYLRKNFHPKDNNTNEKYIRDYDAVASRKSA